MTSVHQSILLGFFCCDGHSKKKEERVQMNNIAMLNSPICRILEKVAILQMNNLVKKRHFFCEQKIFK